jgi:hypothetical protein
LPEVGLRFNVVLIFAVFKVFLHNGENPLNCSAASSALVGSELTSEAIQEVGTHTKIIAVRKADKCKIGVLPDDGVV